MRHAAFGSLLLLSTALTAPAAMAAAQGSPPAQSPPIATPPVQPELQAPDAPVAGPDTEEDVEISGPGAAAAGGEIVVTGRNIPNAIRRTPEVISVLSAADIARTGEGDIAGALQRVTGLSVVGGRFVYVRGLGERYSLALLNGSPLPSPEPLRRVVPLDLFPTSVIASSVVQKSYSVAYPGEFGGGVINLTTRAIPRESFINLGFSVGGDTETTGQLGYTYFGSPTDFTGFDSGERSVPRPLRAALDSGNLIVPGQNFSVRDIQDITASLSNARTTLIQRNNNIPANFGVNLSAGTNFDLGGATLGLVGAAGWSNSWSTRGGLQQVAAGLTPINGIDTLQPDIDYRFLSTRNRIVVNGLFGVGLEFGPHRLRWTNLYIRDSLKEARIQDGVNEINVGSDRVNISNTAWFERQLVSTQGVGELRFGDLSVDLRGAWAQSQRNSPYERQISYRWSDIAKDFVNDLRSNGQFARIAFSELDDTVVSGAADLSYRLPQLSNLVLSAGYAYLDNVRNSTRRDFRYNPLTALPFAVAQQRPDFLLSDYNVYTYGILLTDVSGSAGVAAYEADLRVHAGYFQAEAEPVSGVRVVAGVRYEDGRQSVTPLDLFGLGGPEILPSRINESYWLPAATVTWNFAPDQQLRLHGSKTIARPQFREQAPQQYLDTETSRTFFGNQFLSDSELTNAEARYEWYFDRDQRFSLAGFWKKIDRPIEAVAFQQGGTFFTTFANAPTATLYGAELELQKYFALDHLSQAPFFAARRAVVIGNYTYSDSKIRVRDGDTTVPVGSGGVPVPAFNLFIDGTPLTGQSRHLVNLQLGLENTDRLSQQTILFTYASRRVTNRGPSGQPDLFEEPGIQLDFVMREGVRLFGVEGELKFEARNLTGENYEEFQTLNDSRIDTNSYRLGRSFSLGLSINF
ncbi:MAG: outer membrane beta-barrel protein [Allosphingosinicella sp.]|uniref:outer membrane beta-barrel protein n=1 Tax=Allosphingosinicella sp. TaxID=2823234 RepID=UPI0039580AD6